MEEMEHILSKKFQFCSQCGKPSITFHKDRFLTCRLCGFTYFFNVSSAVVAVIQNQKGELLLTKRAKAPGKDLLDLPGGFMEYDETAEAAVCREIKEELNLDIKDMTYLGSHPGKYHYREMEYEIINLVFQCTTDDLSKINTSEEVSEFVFMAKDQIDLEHIGIEAIKYIIEKYG